MVHGPGPASRRVQHATALSALLPAQAETLQTSTPDRDAPDSSPDSVYINTPDSQNSIMAHAANPADAITKGAVKRMSLGENLTDPVVQCLQIKPMINQLPGQERFKVVLSDSENFVQGMISAPCAHLVLDGLLKRGSLVALKQYTPNMVKQPGKHRTVIIILDAQVLLEYGEHEKIGMPAALVSMDEEEDAKPQPGNITSSNFYGNKPQQQPAQQAQPRSLPSRSNGASHGGHANIYPIEALSPYAHKWTIKARCTYKGEIKTWHKQTSEGKLFSANFLDDSGEIRATGFNDQVDQWYDVLQEGSVYYISSPCRVQLAKKQFSNVNNDYELTFERDTQIEKSEDAEGVPQVSFNFTNIRDLQSVEKDATVDVIGVLQEIGNVEEIVSKTTQKPYNKRELKMVDNSGFDVRLTIWGNTAQTFDAPQETVVAFKGVKVSDFNGRSLSLLSSGSMSINPDIDEAYKLKGWYDGSGRNETFQNHQGAMLNTGAATGRNSGNDYKTIAQVKDENLGMGNDTDWFNVKATIIYVKQDSFAYPACNTTDPKPCNKKVIEIQPGEWRCERCEKTWDRPSYRYIMSVNVSDHTGQMWLSCFDEVGIRIMGMDANKLMELKDFGDDVAVEQAFSDASLKMLVFRCRAKMDTFQDQQRVRYQVHSANPPNFSLEAGRLAEIIKQYNIKDDSLFVN